MYVMASTGFSAPSGMHMLSVQMTTPSEGIANCRPDASPSKLSWKMSPDHAMVSATSPFCSALV